MEQIKLLLQKLSLTPRQLSTYVEAFTHPTYANENQKLHLKHYERLEFLGDSVLYEIVTYFLFTRFPNVTEGQLTPLRAFLIEEGMLFELAKKLHFEDYVLLGTGAAKKDGGRQSAKILADIFEAFLGAIRLDLGMSAVENFVIPLYEEVLKTKTIDQWLLVTKDAKTQLQEHVQGIERRSVTYVVVGEQGPAHDRQFAVEVRLDEMVLGTGTGASKQKAEQAAAKDALSKMAGVAHG